MIWALRLVMNACTNLAIAWVIGSWTAVALFFCYTVGKKETLIPNPRHPVVVYKQTSLTKIGNKPDPKSVFDTQGINLECKHTWAGKVIQIQAEGTIAPQSSGVLTTYIRLDDVTIGIIPVMSVLPSTVRVWWSLNSTLTIDDRGVMRFNGTKSLQDRQYCFQAFPNAPKFTRFDDHRVDILVKWGNITNSKNELEVHSIVVTSF